MDAHQRRSGMNVPHHQGDGFFNPPASVGTKFRSKAVDTKLPPPGGKIRRSDFFHCSDGHTSIITEANVMRIFSPQRYRGAEKTATKKDEI